MMRKKMAGGKVPAPKINILAGVQEELKQVTWPSREEAMQLTLTVIIISLIVAAFVGIIDFSMAKILEILTQQS